MKHDCGHANGATSSAHSGPFAQLSLGIKPITGIESLDETSMSFRQKMQGFVTPALAMVKARQAQRALRLGGTRALTTGERNGLE